MFISVNLCPTWSNRVLAWYLTRIKLFYLKILDTWHKVTGTWENNNNMSKVPLNLGQNLTLLVIPRPWKRMPKPHSCRLNWRAQSANPTVKSHPKSATKNPKPAGGLTLPGAKHVQCKWKMVYSCCLGLSIYQKED